MTASPTPRTPAPIRRASPRTRLRRTAVRRRTATATASPMQADACPDEEGVRTERQRDSTVARRDRATPTSTASRTRRTRVRESILASAWFARQRLPGNGPAEAIFAGFRPNQNGSSTVFVQLTDSVKVEASEKDGEFTLRDEGREGVAQEQPEPARGRPSSTRTSRARSSKRTRTRFGSSCA